MEVKLRSLKLRKARLFSDIESLSEVSDSTFEQFGKLEAEIMKLEKKILHENKNTFDEN